MEQIRITFSPTGETKLEVNGVKGKSCKDLTRAFEKALGTTTKDTETGEFYENPIIQSVDQF
jgi:hypothetical protein